VDTEFVDHEEHWREENYDEYPDEGNAPHLSDFDETDDEADEEEAAGTAIEAADMVSRAALKVSVLFHTNSLMMLW
jgi:hypothetical protein